jgi:PAS domain S-box-containing protein
MLILSGVLNSAAQNTGISCRIASVYVDDTLAYTSDRYSDKREMIDNIPVAKDIIKIVCTADFEGTEAPDTEYSFMLDHSGGGEFSEWSTLRTVSYKDLQDGEYVFKVRARTSDGIMISQAAGIKFTVRTPFEQKKDAVLIVLSSVLTCSVAYFLVRKRMYKKKYKKLDTELTIQNENFNNIKSQLEIQKENLNNTLHDLSVLSQSGQRIIKSMTPGDLSKTAAEELDNFFKSDGIGVGIYNAPHSSIDFSAFVLNGVTMAFARYNIENKNNLVVWSFLHHKSVVISDYDTEISKYIDTDNYKTDTTLSGSAVYVPLSDNDMTIGVLMVRSLQKNFFTPYHLSIIHNLATYIEYAIVNITCMKKISRQKKLLEERYDLLQAANSNLKTKQEELEKLNEQLNRFSVSVRSTENSVVMADENGNISWVNYGFTKIYGYTFEEYTAEGTHYKKALKNPAAIEYFDKAYENGKPVTYTLLHYTKTGKEVWIQSSVTPVTDLDGKVVQLVAVDTDITAVKRAEEEIRTQRNEIALKNKEVTKSIEYASVIQSALMTGESLLRSLFRQSFLLNLPKAIVSGDFFWMSQKFGNKYLALCDCAGHGVPGAFVSLMGKMFLDEILQSADEAYTPGEIIRELNDKLYESVSSLSNKVGGIDGMDLSFCIINSANTEVIYAGAYRPLYIVRKGEINKLLPDRCSLGNIKPSSDFKFQNSKYKLEKGDFLLMSSDGYSDQFGYENGKKMGRKIFCSLVVKASKLDCAEMSDFFLHEHLEWRGMLEQVDDISVAGIVITEQNVNPAEERLSIT